MKKFESSRISLYLQPIEEYHMLSADLCKRDSYHYVWSENQNWLFLHGFHSFASIFYSHTKSFDQSGVWCCNRVTDLTKFLIVKCHAIALSCETIKAQLRLRLDTVTIHFQIWFNNQELLGVFDWQITTRYPF